MATIDTTDSREDVVISVTIETGASVQVEATNEGPPGPRGPAGEPGPQGPPGQDGADGTDGQDGADGVSPEVTISEITGGHSVTITDADHPGGQTFDVMDGADGQDGAPGADGSDGADGADGVSPEVTIASITGGHSVTITDADHPAGQSFNVMDGQDGAPGQDGQDGQDGAPGVGVPSGGTTGQVLKKKSGTDYDTEWDDESGGGTTDYSDLTNKPSIESVTLSGSLTAADLGLAKTTDIPTAYTSDPAALGTASPGSSTNWARGDHVHAKPTYSKSDVGLGNVDNVQQYSASNPPPYPVTSVNGSTGAVSLSIPSSAGDVGAIPAPGSPSSGDVLSYSGSAWAAEAPHYVPAGGNAGQVLKKSSGSDYAYAWANETQDYPSAYCTTGASTAAKKANCSLWTATANSWLHVLIAAANTSAGALTLNVNGQGAKPIYINGAASSSSNYTLPAAAYLVFYDGTNFHFRTDGKLPGNITGHADGDIALPSSPTTGQFLKWSGSAWVASDLPVYSGGVS